MNSRLLEMLEGLPPGEVTVFMGWNPKTGPAPTTEMVVAQPPSRRDILKARIRGSLTVEQRKRTTDQNIDDVLEAISEAWLSIGESR